MLLEIKNLTIHINDKHGVVEAVRNVSFNLHEGETLAIVGESGCGKTILCKSILKLLPPKGKIVGGTVVYKGEIISNYTDKTMVSIRGEKIAMIIQNPMTALNPTFSVGKQICETILLHQNCSGKEAKRKAVDLLRDVGIKYPEERYHSFPHQLSGGMLQRVVIAMAISCNPQIIIADEPTTALDLTIQAEILNLLKEIQIKRNIAMIFVTHDFGVVANIADRVAVMYAGKIIEIGKTEEIFYNPQTPYTWALLAALPSLNNDVKELETIDGIPPDLINPPLGDAFAVRNKYALAIDYKESPPFFKVSETHYAKTWLLDPRAPSVEPPINTIMQKLERGD